MWAAAENSCITWICHHQVDLQAELYQGAVDTLHEGVDAASIGKKVILPASFTSGPQFMQKNLQNILHSYRDLEDWIYSLQLWQIHNGER